MRHPPLTKAHKAAVILAALSAETASSIVQEVSDAHLKAFARAFAELKSVPPQLLHAIAREFVAEVERSSSELAGGIEEAKRILSALTEEDRVNRILAELSGGGSQSVWSRLAIMKTEALQPYIEAQRTPIAAVILSKLPFDVAAGVLGTAAPDFSKAVLAELSRGASPSQEIVDAIAGVVEQEFLKPLAAKPASDGAGEIVGEIINFLPMAKRDAFLAHLDAEDPKIAANVRKAVLTFQDLHLRLPEAGAAALLRAVDKDVLLKSFKHGKVNAPQTVDFLFANISKRMAEQYAEEIAALPDLSEADGEAAQREIMKVVRKLSKNGEVKLSPAPSAT
jgi:flagellar motor switch protein FliG